MRKRDVLGMLRCRLPLSGKISSPQQKGSTVIVLTLLILFIIAAVGSAALGSPMLFVVRQQEASIIERLGKFNRIVQPGLHFLIPIIERRDRADFREPDATAHARGALLAQRQD